MIQNLYTTEGFELDQDKARIPWEIHPRPLMQRDSYLNLCGWWNFSVYIDDRTLFEPRKIRVPFPPESILSGVGEHFPEGATLIYNREVSLPKDFRKETLLLHIDAADQHAEVYVDDKKYAAHSGGYEHFTVDISDVPESFVITIRVKDDLRDLSEPYGKQKVKRGGMWYTPFSGLWQPVWLESVPAEYISHLTIRTDMEKAWISTENDRHNGKITLHTPFGDEIYELKEGKAVLSPANRRNWTPDDPFLYHFELTLTGGDRIQSYFALRQVEIRTINNIPRICLNGEPFFFNGLLDQGYYSDGLSTPADPMCYETDIQTAKDLGFNTLRKHIKVEPDVFYAACDRMGIIVFQDMVNNGSYSFVRDTVLPNIGLVKMSETAFQPGNTTQETFIERCKSTVSQLFSFPSIVYWTIFNEGWGQFDSALLYQIIRKSDPDRVIDATSGWYDTGAGDVQSIHKYNGKYTFEPSSRPVILSEFGGFACRVPEHVYNPSRTYGYGTMKDCALLEQRIKRVYREEILPAIDKGLCGCIYTQLSDVEDEINGLLTWDRKERKILENLLPSNRMETC